MRSCVEDSGDLKDGENADKVGGKVEDGEEVENGERLEDGNDDDTGTETGEGDVDDKGGDLQTWGGDGSLEQFSMVWYTAWKKMVNGGGFNFEAKVALWLYLVMRRNTKKNIY